MLSCRPDQTRPNDQDGQDDQDDQDNQDDQDDQDTLFTKKKIHQISFLTNIVSPFFLSVTFLTKVVKKNLTKSFFFSNFFSLIPQKLKCRQNWNVTKTEMSPKLKCQ